MNSGYGQKVRSIERNLIYASRLSGLHLQLNYFDVNTLKSNKNLKEGDEIVPISEINSVGSSSVQWIKVVLLVASTSCM